MHIKLIDFCNDIKLHTHAEAVARSFINFATNNGACTVTTFFGTKTQQQFLSTIPPSFMDKFHEEGTVYSMHTVKAVRAGVPQSFYGIELCANNPHATLEGLDWADQCFDQFGLRSGVTFAMPNHRGEYEGAGMGMGFEDNGESFLKLMKEFGGIFGTAAFIAYSRMELLYNKKVDPSPLSKRQSEILQFLSMGHRTDSIANKLGISNSAVNLYLANLKQKLNVKTREQAIAQALINGWIKL